MPRNKRTDNFRRSEAERKDRRDAAQFSGDRAAEGVHAEARTYNEQILALVISKEEHDRLVAAENAAMHDAHSRTAPHELRYADDTDLSAAGFRQRPDLVPGKTRMEALTTAYAAYLGATAMHDSGA